jgi:hypothetical protein
MFLFIYTPAAHGLEELFSAVLERFLKPIHTLIFGVTYKLRVKYKIGRRNRYLEGRKDRQMTPHGYPNFNSYVKNLHALVVITDRQTDRQTDRRTDRDINPVWASLTTFLQVNLEEP